MTELKRCRSCDAPIIWARTAKGKSIPLDASPTSEGNIVLAVFNVAHVLRSGESAAGRPTYTSHFATCPNAAEHRR